MIPLLQSKRWSDAIIRSVAEGTSSVQNIITVITTIIFVVSSDIVLHIICPALSGLCIGLVMCLMTVYAWPVRWAGLFGITILGIINYQAGGEALLAGVLTMMIIQYAKLRMVNTDFSHRVLLVCGYSAFEAACYALMSTALLGVLLMRVALVTGLFFLYTIKTG